MRNNDVFIFGGQERGVGEGNRGGNVLHGATRDARCPTKVMRCDASTASLRKGSMKECRCERACQSAGTDKEDCFQARSRASDRAREWVGHRAECEARRGAAHGALVCYLQSVCLSFCSGFCVSCDSATFSVARGVIHTTAKGCATKYCCTAATIILLLPWFPHVWPVQTLIGRLAKYFIQV